MLFPFCSWTHWLACHCCLINLHCRFVWRVVYLEWISKSIWCNLFCSTWSWRLVIQSKARIFFAPCDFCARYRASACVALKYLVRKVKDSWQCCILMSIPVLKWELVKPSGFFLIPIWVKWSLTFYTGAGSWQALTWALQISSSPRKAISFRTFLLT